MYLLELGNNHPSRNQLNKVKLQCSIAENGKKLGFKEEENESFEISFIPLPWYTLKKNECQ